MKHLKEKILYCLEHIPETRDDDMLLTFEIIRNYYPEEIQLIGEKWFISTKALREIREDCIKRIRCVIQNREHRFLPTTQRVAEKRKINEKVWLNYLNNENTRL
jgi:hypothetical protein